MGTARDLVVASTSCPPWMASVLKLKVGFPLLALIAIPLLAFDVSWNLAVKNKTTHDCRDRGSFENPCGYLLFSACRSFANPQTDTGTHAHTHGHGRVVGYVRHVIEQV